MQRIETIDLLKLMVSQMSFTFKADDIEDIGGDKYTLLSCSTFHLMPNAKITIGATEYTVVAVVHNTSITISGTVFPTSNEFSIRNPFFFHGRVSDVDGELRPIASERDKFPMLYVMQDYDETFYNADEDKDRDVPLRLFFLATNDPTWDIVKHNSLAIKPMRNLAYSFLEFAEQQTYIDDILEYRIRDHMKFGRIDSETKKLKKMFSEFLSGVELSLTLGIMKSAAGCCNNLVGKTMATIVDQDGNIVAKLEPGQIYEVTVFDTLEDDPDLNDESTVEDIVNNEA